MSRFRAVAAATRSIAVRNVIVLGLAWAASAAQAQTIFRDGFESAKPAGRGGSNLIWHDLAGCDREPYGALPNYHEPGVRARVQGQLAQMRAEGQERISLGLYHLRGVPDSFGRITGTILDSTGGTLHLQQRQNLVWLLADIRNAGFASFVFRYHPQGANDPKSWVAFDADRFEENWSLIAALEPLLQASGLPHGTDLMVEGMPRARIVELPGNDVIVPDEPHREPWSRYARDLWSRYVKAFGTTQTVGFSFVSDTDDGRIDARVEHKDYVYTVDGTLQMPIALAFDIYGTVAFDERYIFERYHHHLKDEGLASVPWLITESYYDDAAAARAFSEAMTITGQSVLFLTQWPLRRVSACNDVDVAPPVDYSNYRPAGF